MTDYRAMRRIRIPNHKTGERELIEVELFFNLDKIANLLGIKAVRNKSGKSKLAIGVEAVAKRRIDR